MALVRKSIHSAGAAVVALSLTMGLAVADPVTDFYEKNTITLNVASTPSGMYAAYSHVLSRHMSRHIPGNPNIVVKAIPGAGGITGANYIYNVAAKNGSIIAVIPAEALFEPLFGNKQANYDATKFSWIGNIDKSVGLCAVWHTTGMDKFEDLTGAKKPVIFGSSSATSATTQHANALKALLGAKINVIRGYDGGQLKLAMERGEVEGRCGLALSMLQVEYADDYKSGRLKLLLQLAREKSPKLPNVPHIYDYAKNKEMRQMFDLIYGRQEIGRSVAAPPGIPKARLSALQDAFEATMKDPKFLAEANKSKLIITPSTAAEIKDILQQYASYPLDVLVSARKYMVMDVSGLCDETAKDRSLCAKKKKKKSKN